MQLPHIQIEAEKMKYLLIGRVAAFVEKYINISSSCIIQRYSLLLDNDCILPLI